MDKNNTSDNLTRVSPDTIFKGVDWSKIPAPQYNIPQSVLDSQQKTLDVIKNFENPVVKEQRKTNVLLSETNNELQIQLSKANEELKQLNNKASEYKYQIKLLKSELEEESRKRFNAENQISRKEWKVLIYGFCFTVIALGIEHWSDIYNFILSLIGFQK